MADFKDSFYPAIARFLKDVYGRTDVKEVVSVRQLTDWDGSETSPRLESFLFVSYKTADGALAETNIYEEFETLMKRLTEQ